MFVNKESLKCFADTTVICLFDPDAWLMVALTKDMTH